MISLHAKGMTPGDIANHLSDVYGASVSRELVSKVTDAVLADMTAWQTRPLDPVYPVVLSNARVLLEASMVTPGVREHWPTGRCDEHSLLSRRVQ